MGLLRINSAPSPFLKTALLRYNLHGIKFTRLSVLNKLITFSEFTELHNHCQIPTLENIFLIVSNILQLSFFFLIYLFLAVLGLCFCARAFSSCGEPGLHFVAVHGLLIAVASLVVDHGL